MEKIKLCELFGPTVEGEGFYLGVPFIVIRTSGCNLKCDYCDTKFCLEGNTEVLMKDFSQKKIKDINIGDEVICIHKGKWKVSKVTHTSKTEYKEKPLVKVSIENNSIVCTEDHRFLTKWSMWTQAKNINCKIRTIPTNIFQQTVKKEDKDYICGYLGGAWLGDGSIWVSNKQYQARLQSIDKQFIDELFRITNILKIESKIIENKNYCGKENHTIWEIRISSKGKGELIKRIKEFSQNFQNSSKSFKRGFIAGFFDAEGCLNSAQSNLFFSQKKLEILDLIEKELQNYEFKTNIKDYRNINTCYSLNILGNLYEKYRFFKTFNPKILRKWPDFLDTKTASIHKKPIIEKNIKIEDKYVYDITTEYGNFIGNGFIVHNSSWYNNDEKEYLIEEILEYIDNHPCKNVSITGGEPFHRSEEELASLLYLCKKIKEKYPEGVIKVETNATIFRKEFLPYIDFWSLSPKLKGMGDKVWFSKDVIREYIDNMNGLATDMQLKFVIGSREKNGTIEEDLNAIKDLINEFPDIKEYYIPIILQPEGLTESIREYLKRGETLVERVVNSNKIDWDYWKDLNLRVLPQWHRLLWNNARRK